MPKAAKVKVLSEPSATEGSDDAPSSPAKAPRKSRRTQRVINYDLHCGVTKDNGLPCTTSLFVCPMHKVPFKRAVVGRTKTYDELRAEWRATRAAAQEAKEKAEKEEKEEEETVSNLVLVKAEPGLEVETAPQTAQPTEDSPNSHDDAYPTFHTPDANTDLAARRPDDEIAWLSAHATHLRAETSALTNQLRDFHRQAQARVMEILWLQREKSALQRAVADLATSAPGAADQLQSQPSLQNTGENPQGSVLTQDGQKQPRPYLWDPEQNIDVVLNVLFTSAPKGALPLPPQQFLNTLTEFYQHEISFMTSLGHAVVDMDSRVPVFDAGPFLQCPAHGAGTPIFGMTEWHFGFFHHGCFGCSAANTVCPLFGHVYHFVRLAYRGRMTVAWVPDTWLARVLCHAAIP